MDIRERLRDKGATDAQINAKVVDLLEEVIAEMTDEELNELGFAVTQEVRNALVKAVKEMVFEKQKIEKSFWRINQEIQYAQSISKELREKVDPYRSFIEKNYKAMDSITDSVKAIHTYKGILEATKEVFGEDMPVEVMAEAIKAGSYGAWRAIMGEK